MLPHIALPEDTRQKLLCIKYPGDLVEAADNLSMDMFQKVLLTHPEYTIQNIASDTLLHAIVGQTFAGIPFADREKYLRIASDRQQFKRAILASICDDPASLLKLNGREKLLLSGFLQMASLFDELFIQWRIRVVTDAMTKASKKDPHYMTSLRREHGLLTIPYVFSVLEIDDDGYREEALISAFPVIVGRIVTELKKLTEAYILEDGKTDMVNYLNGLMDFYENDKPDKYEFLSRGLDILWLKLSGKIMPIHAMEVYEDPGKYIVSPEFTIAIVDERHKGINKGIADVKEKMLATLDKEYGTEDAYMASRDMMASAKGAVYTFGMESGARLSFRPFAQNIPNWDEVRQKNGVRIFIDMLTSKLRWQMQKQSLYKVFGNIVVDGMYEQAVIDESLFQYAATVQVGGHEIAHNAFIASDVQERLTPPFFAKLEETKASLTILSIVAGLYKPEEQRIIALAELADDMAKFANIDDQARVAYLHTTIVSLRAFMSAGVIVVTDGIYTIDTGEDKILTYYKEIEKICKRIVSIYASGTETEAAAFIEKYFVIDELLRPIADILTVYA